MDIFDLKGKTAFITGAAGGLGSRFAQVLASAGVHIIAADLHEEALESLRQDVTKQGGNILTTSLNIADEQSVTKVVALLEKEKKIVDICINAAGITRLTPIFGENSQFESVIQVNLIGTWFITKHIANHMKNHNIAGSIINIASMNGFDRPAPTVSAYCASKAGVIYMTKSLVSELGEHHIRINAICPGLFPSGMTKDIIAEQSDYWKNITPLGYLSEPSDLDGTILYLASNAASRCVTGACITVDGGVSCRGL